MARRRREHDQADRRRDHKRHHARHQGEPDRTKASQMSTSPGAGTTRRNTPPIVDSPPGTAPPLESDGPATAALNSASRVDPEGRSAPGERTSGGIHDVGRQGRTKQQRLPESPRSGPGRRRRTPGRRTDPSGCATPSAVTSRGIRNRVGVHPRGAGGRRNSRGRAVGAEQTHGGVPRCIAGPGFGATVICRQFSNAVRLGDAGHIDCAGRVDGSRRNGHGPQRLRRVRGSRVT